MNDYGVERAGLSVTHRLSVVRADHPSVSVAIDFRAFDFRVGLSLDVLTRAGRLSSMVLVGRTHPGMGFVGDE